MAIVNNIQIDHFPLLGKNKKEYSLLDLSISGDIYKNNRENWRDELGKLAESESVVFYGGYLEKRFFYSNNELFGKGDQKRDIHIGVDLWAKEGTKIYCPFNATVHSMANNNTNLDYGYTVILQHQLDGFTFYSLYGHLSDDHLLSLKVNDSLPSGSSFCQIGDQNQNGNWPPHLHFQLIIDIGNHFGDYPGVCNSNDLEFYNNNCPDGSSFIF